MPVGPTEDTEFLDARSCMGISASRLVFPLTYGIHWSLSGKETHISLEGISQGPLRLHLGGCFLAQAATDDPTEPLAGYLFIMGSQARMNLFGCSPPA